jgi:hypothetical protein
MSILFSFTRLNTVVVANFISVNYKLRLEVASYINNYSKHYKSIRESTQQHTLDSISDHR